MQASEYYELLNSEAVKALNPENASIFAALLKTHRNIENISARAGDFPGDIALAVDSLTKTVARVDPVAILIAMLISQETDSARARAVGATEQEKAIMLNKIMEYLQSSSGDGFTWGCLYTAGDSIAAEKAAATATGEIAEARKLAEKYEVTKWGFLPKKEK